MSVRRIKLTVAGAILGVALCASVAGAQSRDSASHAAPPVAIWAGLSVGPGYASNRPQLRLLGGQLGVFGSYGPWLAGYRRGGASGIESGGAYDDALLAGWRFRGAHSTMFAAVGPANVYDESTGTSTRGIGFTAEAGANERVIGLGVSAFGAFATHRWYAGIGLTVDAGWIRGPE